MKVIELCFLEYLSYRRHLFAVLNIADQTLLQSLSYRRCLFAVLNIADQTLLLLQHTPISSAIYLNENQVCWFKGYSRLRSFAGYLAMEIKFKLYFLITFLLLHFTKNAESSSLTVKPSTTEAVIGEKTVFNCSSVRGSDGIQWFHYPKTSPERQIVYGFDQIYAAYKAFRIEKNNKTGALNLIIPSVSSTNAGKYECQDEYGRGDKSHAELIVLETTPVCQSDSDINKVVGENNCGIQPDKLLLSCIVQYTGNEHPVLNWKRVGGGNTNGFVLPPTVQSDRVIYNISLSGDSLVNRSSYECVASRGSSSKSSCRLGNMTIISKSVSCIECVCQDSSNVAIIALVIVFVIIPIVAGVTASLVYYFLVYEPKSKLVADFVDGKKYIKAVFLVTLLLLPFYVGMFAILAKYLIVLLQKRRQQKNKESQNFITEPGSNQTTNAPDVKKEGPDSDQLNDRKEPSVDKLMKEIQQWKAKYGKVITNGSELNKAIEKLHFEKAELNNKIQDIQNEKGGLVIKIQHLLNENETLKSKVKELEQRLFQPDPEDYSEKSALVHKITTKAHENEKKAITGIAVLEKSLFISHQETTKIEVYDSATYMYVRQLLVPDIIGPIGISDMASCVSCLILIGQFKESSNCSGIRQIDTKGRILKHWPSGGNAGRLSVHESNVIVCLSDKLEIREFNKNGELIQTVRLSPAVGLIHPWHAIKVTSLHFIVSHGEEGDKLHRVCLVDLEGNILKECREQGKDNASSPSTFKVPFCLLEDDMRSILVVDREHQRIILLNSSLKWQKKLLDTIEKVTSEKMFKEQRQLPVRLSFDDTGNRLFVAVNKFSSNAWKRGQVLIFNVK